MGEFFNAVFINPIVNILVALYQLFSLVHLPYALGFAIVGLTIVIRFLLYPLISAQLKASLKMQKVAPHLSNLKDKHKGDAKTLQAETMKLYKEHGINPAAGCLPVLVQMPVIWALYTVLQKMVTLKPDSIVSEVNKIVYFDFLKLNASWDTSFFGFPLGVGPSELFSKMGPLVFLVPILTGVFQFLLSKMMMPATPKNALVVKAKKDDFATAFQSQSLFIFPVMIGFFSYSFPIGLSLYWNTFTIFGMIQQYKIAGLGGLDQWIKKQKQ